MVMLSVGESTLGVFEPYISIVDQLIDATLSNYGEHSCVLGFVVEVEFRSSYIEEGRLETDAEFVYL